MSKHNKVRLLSSFLLSIVILGICGVVCILSHTLLKDWLIISFGVRTFRIISIVEFGATGICAFATAVNGVPLMIAAMLQKHEQEQELAQKRQQSQILADYTEDSTNPDYTRKRLLYLREEMPGAEDLVQRCLEQMDSMDRLQAKQEFLIQANDASYLRDTIAVLDNVERRICRNFQNVVNLCIAVDRIEQLDMKEVEKYLRNNQKKLNDTSELLTASAKRINQYNAGDDRSAWDEVRSWIETIRSSLEEED